jgi:hypothetical protein
MLTKILEADPRYVVEADNDKRKSMENRAFEQLLSYLYLENADQSKYGSLLVGLNTQQSLGNDQYPKSISEANHVLSNHKFDSSTKSATNPKHGN